MTGEDGGSDHLARIGRFQLLLLPLGTGAWAFRSWRAALVFAVGGAASILFWTLHRWVVTGMLTPSVRRRWLYGFLVLAKLALIVVLLRGMMFCFPSEVLPFVTGVLLFSASILLEGFWLIFRPD
jgi:hypothetical protein